MYTSLIFTSLLATFASAQSNTDPVTGILGDAVVVSNNPVGAVYTATLPNNNNSNVRGSVVAQAASGGQGVHFDVSITGLPASGGPFLYHIHVDPVPADGNCTGTLAHLDPTERGEMPMCNASAPATCQVGDLSGKHGLIPVNVTTFTASYTDLYASTLPGIGAFFGNRSIVVHYNNKTRITCANFTLSSAAPYSNASMSAATTAPATMTATVVPSMYTGGAATLGGFGVLAGFAGAIAALV